MLIIVGLFHLKMLWLAVIFLIVTKLPQTFFAMAIHLQYIITSGETVNVKFSKDYVRLNTIQPSLDIILNLKHSFC